MRYVFTSRSCNYRMPIPVAARSNAWVYGRLFPGTVGSNPTEGMDVYLVRVVFCQVEVSASG
jgi:hypothetical protein